MRVIEVKCYHCGKVAHNYDLRFSQMDTTNFVMLRCLECGKYIKVRIHMPVPYNLGYCFEYINVAYETPDNPYRKEWEEHKSHRLRMIVGNPRLEQLAYAKLSKHFTDLTKILYNYCNALLAGVSCAPDLRVIYVSHEYVNDGMRYRSVWAKDIFNEEDYNLNDLCLIQNGPYNDNYRINKPDVGLGYLIVIDSENRITKEWI